jgi:hypothetical protein
MIEQSMSVYIQARSLLAQALRSNIPVRKATTSRAPNAIFKIFIQAILLPLEPCSDFIGYSTTYLALLFDPLDCC